MAQSFSQNQPENTYVINAESGAEMARLIDQDHIITQAMGGLFSERDDFSTIVDVLDIGCGPGGWVLDVASTYPEMEVTGIDISHSMIQYAQTYARVQGLPNARFQVMNALQPLHFPDASFDLINARTIFAFVSPLDWPHLIAECRRILRPGGILRLSEAECSITNKAALETFFVLLNQAFLRTGRSFSPKGSHLGITPVMKRLLRNGGFQTIQQKVHVVDYSVGMPAYTPTYEDWKAGLYLIQPFLISTGVTSKEEIEQLYEQAMIEMLEEDFCGLFYLLTAWGETPKGAEQEEEVF